MRSSTCTDADFLQKFDACWHLAFKLCNASALVKQWWCMVNKSSDAFTGGQLSVAPYALQQTLDCNGKKTRDFRVKNYLMDQQNNNSDETSFQKRSSRRSHLLSDCSVCVVVFYAGQRGNDNTRKSLAYLSPRHGSHNPIREFIAVDFANTSFCVEMVEHVSEVVLIDDRPSKLACKLCKQLLLLFVDWFRRWRHFLNACFVKMITWYCCLRECLRPSSKLSQTSLHRGSISGVVYTHTDFCNPTRDASSRQMCLGIRQQWGRDSWTTGWHYRITTFFQLSPKIAYDLHGERTEVMLYL